MKQLIQRRNLISLGAGSLGGLLMLALYSWAFGPGSPRTISEMQLAAQLQNVADMPSAPTNFKAASALAMPAVVHIKSTAGQEPGARGPEGSQRMPEGMEEFHRFFGMPDMPQGPRMGTGSGVILTEDGYIVTNNHVIADADKVEVTLFDNQTFPARVIGTDPSTDLALLKIDAQALTFLPFGDSDALEVGEWVLAVGNPFNLTSTVTAGIVSAKGRNLGIVEDKYRIESFIQTDAAVNPGNSGGALVTTEGKLVGINTAIATRTGSYSGYSFAVPVTIVRKVVDDLMQYGTVQRAFLGVQIRDVDAALAQAEDLASTRGVYVQEVNDGSAADAAGIKAGDVVIAVDGHPIKTSSELQETIGRHRPGDKVGLKLMRGKTEKDLTVILKNQSGTTQLVKKEATKGLQWLGADFAPLDGDDKKRLGLDHGVRVQKLTAGKLRYKGIREGFVITEVNRRPVHTADDIQQQLQGLEAGALVTIEGYYTKGEKEVYSFYF